MGSPVARHKSIVVAGDLIRDHYLVQYKNAPLNYNSLYPQAINLDIPGGAWFLRDLVVMTCADVAGKVAIHELPYLADHSVNNAYTTWAQYPESHVKKNLVWRANPFMGCNRPVDGKSAFAKDGGVPDPDVLVLDDLGLGFRDNDELWPAALKEGKPRRIVLKTCHPCTGSKLWDHLIENKDYRDNLTVVLSADALRDGGARISETLSWDAVIEELRDEFSKDGLGWSGLGRCRRVIIVFGHGGIATFSRYEPHLKSEPLIPNEPSEIEIKAYDRASFERLIYVPEELEDSWTAARPGITFSGLSLVTAGVARHELFRSFYASAAEETELEEKREKAYAEYERRKQANEPSEEMDEDDMTPTDYRSLNITLGRALAAKRKLHERGGWLTDPKKQRPLPTDLFARKDIESILNPGALKKYSDEPASKFAVAFCRRALNREPDEKCYSGKHTPQLKPCNLCQEQPALLYNVTGYGTDYITAKAIELVVRGIDSALAKAPKACYGNYITVDREEIERINAIRKLIVDYQADANDKRPLSIAVFGPPGSGKSFAIKELAKDIFGKDKEPLQFNLSQFASVGELHRAFHQVRDASVKGYIPLVFWDEFDSPCGDREWGWLKNFLAPMQDSEFFSDGLSHPFGKAIFIFAGGQCTTFSSFSKTFENEDKYKGRDFISRLRGYLNMKGPNPEDMKDNAGRGAEPNEPAYLIRRAMLLRSTLERSYGHLINEAKHAAISMAVIHAFLFVEKYLHGARSLESLVKMSGLESVPCFTASCLPSASLLGMHVTPDFKKLTKENPFTEQVIDDLARETHNAWLEMRRKQGRKKNQNYIKYEKMKPDEKVNNYESAWRVEPKLKKVNLRTIRLLGNEKQRAFDDEEKNRLCILEHEIWMRRYLVTGYEWAPWTNKSLGLHCNVAPFEVMPPMDQELDQAIVEAIPGALEKNKLGFEKNTGPTQAKTGLARETVLD